jgi:uncharacterized SAM-binding protein YcdF (DUF218 family)
MPAMQKLYTSRGLRGVARGLMLAVVTLAIVLGLVCALIVFQAGRDDLQDAAVGRVGAAIVLGSAPGGGAPSPALRARLDHALDLYRRGQVRLIVLTGSAGQGQNAAEAEIGKRYLAGLGLPAEVLLTESQSTTTLEHLRNSVALIQANHVGAVVLVSEPFHMLRALKMTRDLGLIAYSSPARAGDGSAGRLDAIRTVLREAGAYLAYLFARQ